MNKKNLLEKDILLRFEEKILGLKDTLPPLGKNIRNSCAADTLNSIIEIIDLGEGVDNY
jgi:hypothetical protein